MTASPREVVEAIQRDFPEIALAKSMWLVGGAVRDALIGRSSPDVDLVGKDAEKQALEFAHASSGRLVDLGRERFPTWRVVVEGRTYDFSEMVGDAIAADLARRDFTMNALAIDLATTAPIEDPFGGRGDIETRCVRMVSRRNLAEDPLRVLKAVRMAVNLEFDIDGATLRACAELAPQLVRVAPERIAAEMDIIFGASDLSRVAALFRDTGMDEIIFGRQVPPALGAARGGDPVLAWATMFRAADAAELRRLAAEFRWSSALRSAIGSLLHADKILGEGVDAPEELDVLLYDAGAETSARLVRLREAWGESETAAAVRARLNERGTALFSIEPLLTGDEIATVGVLLPGPEIGRLKRDLLVAQIRGVVRTRDEAVAWVREKSEPA